MSSKPKHFHFIGICGTAMGAVAAAMKERGFKISGSDSAVYPPISTFLESRGIKLERGYRAANIPEKADVIVVGNAISRGNEELEEVLNIYRPEGRQLEYLHTNRRLKLGRVSLQLEQQCLPNREIVHTQYSLRVL